MTFMPVFKFSLVNTFLFVFFYLLASTIVAYFASKDGFKRGSDRSWIGSKDKLSAFFSGYVFLAFIVLSIFVPIKIDSILFYIGVVIYIISFILSLYANVSYVTAPLDKLITQGIYKYSRNPAYVCNSLLILSIALISGTYLFIIFFFVFLFSSYFTILVEEKYCMREYGEEYEKYLKETPRYFWFIWLNTFIPPSVI